MQNNVNIGDPIVWIRPGARVTILVPNGIGRHGVEYAERTGRAVICGRSSVALNMGGRHGTPGVATEANLVSFRNPKNSVVKSWKA